MSVGSTGFVVVSAVTVRERREGEGMLEADDLPDRFGQLLVLHSP